MKNKIFDNSDSRTEQILSAIGRLSLREKKLLLLFLSRIESRDTNNLTDVTKNDAARMLKITDEKTIRYTDLLRSIQKKTSVFLPCENGTESCPLIRAVYTDSKRLYVEFDSAAVPSLCCFQKQIFDVASIWTFSDLQHRKGFDLLVCLVCWSDPNAVSHRKKVEPDKLLKLFGLCHDRYQTRRSDRDASFNWSSFERYCLNPAVQDIDMAKSCPIALRVDRRKATSQSPALYCFDWIFPHPAR